MPLTPQDVQARVFGPTRFRRGYDENEVDAFLDEVEGELTRLHREIEKLTSQAGAGSEATGLVQRQPAVQFVKPTEDVARFEPRLDSRPADATAEREVALPEPEEPAATGAGSELVAGDATTRDGDLEQQVARTLVLAQRAADEAVRDAELQADHTRGQAQAEAERIVATAREQATQELASIEQDKGKLEDRIEELRVFEHEYRTRLRAYLDLQLRELDGGGPSASGGERRAAAAMEPDVSTDPGRGLLTTGAPGGGGDGEEMSPAVTTTGTATRSGPGRLEEGEEFRHERNDLHDEL